MVRAIWEADVPRRQCAAAECRNVLRPMLYFVSFPRLEENSHDGQMVGPCSQAGPAPGWQAMARFSQLPIGESALGIGPVRRSERARLQGLSRSVRALGGRSACDCARGGFGREC